MAAAAKLLAMGRARVSRPDKVNPWAVPVSWNTCAG